MLNKGLMLQSGDITKGIPIVILINGGSLLQK